MSKRPVPLLVKPAVPDTEPLSWMSLLATKVRSRPALVIAPLRVSVPPELNQVCAAPRVVLRPQALVPTELVRPDSNVSGLPARKNPPLVNCTEERAVAKSLTFVCWAGKPKTTRVAGPGSAPPQLPLLPQLFVPAPPVQTKGVPLVLITLMVTVACAVCSGYWPA